MITSTPCWNACVCGDIPTPPMTTALRVLRPLPNRSLSAPICRASSRVGASTRARVPCLPSSRSRIGSTNASVLPVPVAAQPITSLPSSAGGMACAWIGVGASKPARASKARLFPESPSSPNCIRRPYPDRARSASISTVVGELLARRAAPRIAGALAFRAQRRVRHHLEAPRRDLVAALVADPELVGIVLDLAQRPIDAGDPLRLTLVPLRSDRLQHLRERLRVLVGNAGVGVVLAIRFDARRALAERLVPHALELLLPDRTVAGVHGA